MRKAVVAGIVGVGLLAGCVSPGYEGQLGSMTSNQDISAQREANRAITVYQTTPTGFTSLGPVSVRRCHRNQFEDEPSEAAFINDLKMSAFALGGDAISNIETQKLNGLLANCWYVVEATALVWVR